MAYLRTRRVRNLRYRRHARDVIAVGGGPGELRHLPDHDEELVRRGRRTRRPETDCRSPSVLLAGNGPGCGVHGDARVVVHVGVHRRHHRGGPRGRRRVGEGQADERSRRLGREGRRGRVVAQRPEDREGRQVPVVEEGGREANAVRLAADERRSAEVGERDAADARRCRSSTCPFTVRTLLIHC